MRNKLWRNSLISVFVIVWTVVFHYESTRSFFLNPLFGRDLPQMKFLFPPAGWIMFYNVDDTFSSAEVYGVKDGQPQLIDPHQILTTRSIGYDNVHRNALSTVLYPNLKGEFCRYLHRKFPYFDNFWVTLVYWPSVTKTPFRRLQKIMYQCEPQAH